MIGRLARAAARRARRLVPTRPRPAILMYHRVAEESFDPWGLAVSPDHFTEQLEWLAQARTILPLAQFAAMHADGTLPAGAVAITFDDAYQCTAEVAAPLLERAELHATIFAPAELIERGAPFWWDELQQIVLGHEGDRLTLEDEQVILGPRRADDRQWRPDAPPRTPRQLAFHRIWASLRERRPAELDEAMAKLHVQVRMAEPITIPVPMSIAQVCKTASDRIQFGSHALSHPWLTSLTDAEKGREIGDSVERVERLTGRQPAAFAYPYGNFDAESERIVADAGFACACATQGRTVAPASSCFALPRVGVGNWTASELRLRLRA